MPVTLKRFYFRIFFGAAKGRRETGGRRLEAGSRKSEVRNRRSEARCRMNLKRLFSLSLINRRDNKKNFALIGLGVWIWNLFGNCELGFPCSPLAEGI